MFDINQKLRVFCPGRGTFEIEIIEVRKWVYGVTARDYQGGFYEYINEWTWLGPKGEKYFTLDNNNKFKDPKMRKSYEQDY